MVITDFLSALYMKTVGFCSLLAFGAVWSGRILGTIRRNNCLCTATNVFNFKGLTAIPSNLVTVGSREDGIGLNHVNRNFKLCYVMLCYVMLFYAYNSFYA